MLTGMCQKFGYTFWAKFHQHQMNQRAQLLKKQMTSHPLYHHCHHFTTLNQFHQLYQPQYHHHHILPAFVLQLHTISQHSIFSHSPDSQLQCHNYPSFHLLCSISVTCSLQQKKTHRSQATNQLTTWMPVLQTSCQHRIDPAIEKKVDVMNKRLMTVERNQVEIKDILGYILQSLKRDQPLQQHQQQQ